MSVDLEDLRLAVYRSLASTGVAPSIAELGAQMQTSAIDIRDGLRSLRDARHLVLDADDRVVLAHPFATVPLGFSVMGRSTLWWGGCVWDSFAIPDLVDDEPEVLVATRCPACGAAHALLVDRFGPPRGTQVAHFLVPVRSIWDDVLRACGNQRVFCDEACVDRWLRDANEARGYVADLATVWRLASRWYEGRLERGYQRRDPESAVAYFRSVGLTGEFWEPTPPLA